MRIITSWPAIFRSWWLQCSKSCGRLAVKALTPASLTPLSWLRRGTWELCGTGCSCPVTPNKMDSCHWNESVTGEKNSFTCLWITFLLQHPRFASFSLGYLLHIWALVESSRLPVTNLTGAVWVWIMSFDSCWDSHRDNPQCICDVANFTELCEYTYLSLVLLQHMYLLQHPADKTVSSL